MAESKRKEIIRVCVPGNQFSGAYMDSWTQLFGWLLMHGFRVIMHREFVSTLPVVRHRCLGVGGGGGPRKQVFDGEYDYILWLDSDQTFTPDDFITLYADLSLSPDNKIACGYYKYADMTGFAFGWFAEDGTPKHVTRGSGDVLKKAKEGKDLIQVDWTGMGFVLMKKGVFEAIDYPYFCHPEFMLEGQDPDVLGEDLYFGYKLKKANIPIFIDPRVRVGHVKEVIL